MTYNFKHLHNFNVSRATLLLFMVHYKMHIGSNMYIDILIPIYKSLNSENLYKSHRLQDMMHKTESKPCEANPSIFITKQSINVMDVGSRPTLKFFVSILPQFIAIPSSKLTGYLVYYGYNTLTFQDH